MRSNEDPTQPKKTPKHKEMELKASCTCEGGWGVCVCLCLCVCFYVSVCVYTDCMLSTYYIPTTILDALHKNMYPHKCPMK